MGVVLACPPCFLGFGVLLVSRFFLLLAVWSWGVGGRVVGGFLGFGVGAPGSCSLWGVGVGCAWRARLLCSVRGLGACARLVLASLVWGWGWVRVRLVLAPCGGGGWVCLCVWFILGMRFPGVGWAARLLCFVQGLGVPGFLFRVRGGFWSCSRRGFRVFLFPLGASFLWFGGCRVGLGLFFSGCSARSGLVSGSGSGVGFVWRV